MKREFNIAILACILLLFFGCDYESSYSFIVKNSTDKTIELNFFDSTDYSRGNQSEQNYNKPKVTLLNGEEKIIRIIYGGLNTPPHDCLQDHGISYFKSLAFDTFIDNNKIEKQLWLPENWEYKKTGRYSVDYKLTITNELLSKK